MDPQQVAILLVEDTAVMRKIEIKTLKSLGFETIHEAVDGREAMAVLQADKGIDLVISDWNMPNMGGLELLKWMRRSEDFKKLPFIMATGQGEKKQEKIAVDTGANCFVAKPFDATELKSRIDSALGGTKTQAEDLPTGLQRSASGKIKLRFAHIQITDHLILGVLKHMLQRNMVKAEHFELETQCMPSWNSVAQSLENGTVDAACVLAPIAMDLFNAGVPIKLILLAHKNGSIFVRSRTGRYSEPYQDFFRDRTFYIPHKMSIHHMLAHMFFSRIGLSSGMMQGDPLEVAYEVCPPIKMPEFLGSNPEACGFMVAEPLGTKAIASELADLQFLSGELWEGHPCCVVAMRDDFIEPQREAVFELTRLLVQAGKFIEKNPTLAAEVAVDFLDPEKKLGLKVPILKNVLLEQMGIKTGDLFPVIEDLEAIQQYMYHKMGTGALIDLAAFVDARFAEAACTDRPRAKAEPKIQDTASTAMEILKRGATGGSSKARLNAEGQYLTFVLDAQEYGIDILKVKEIIAMMPIRSIPWSDPSVKGVINLRDEVIPIIDLRDTFGLEACEAGERACIIVLEFESQGRRVHMGITVDEVLEVQSINAEDIEDPPALGAAVSTDYLLAMAKIQERITLLLDIEAVLGSKPAQPAAVEEVL